MEIINYNNLQTLENYDLRIYTDFHISKNTVLLNLALIRAKLTSPLDEHNIALMNKKLNIQSYEKFCSIDEIAELRHLIEKLDTLERIMIHHATNAERLSTSIYLSRRNEKRLELENQLLKEKS